MRHRRRNLRFSNAAGRKFRSVAGIPAGSPCNFGCMCLNVDTQTLSTTIHEGVVSYPDGENNPLVCNGTCPPCTGKFSQNVYQSQLTMG